jgi:hypothetical protein
MAPNWPAFFIFASAVMVPPILMERWYGSNWWLALAASAAVALPFYWRYQRMRERRAGLPLTSFWSFLGRFLGG